MSSGDGAAPTMRKQVASLLACCKAVKGGDTSEQRLSEMWDVHKQVLASSEALSVPMTDDDGTKDSVQQGALELRPLLHSFQQAIGGPDLTKVYFQVWHSLEVLLDQLACLSGASGVRSTSSGKGVPAGPEGRSPYATMGSLPIRKQKGIAEEGEETRSEEDEATGGGRRASLPHCGTSPRKPSAGSSRPKRAPRRTKKLVRRKVATSAAKRVVRRKKKRPSRQEDTDSAASSNSTSPPPSGPLQEDEELLESLFQQVPPAKSSHARSNSLSSKPGQDKIVVQLPENLGQRKLDQDASDAEEDVHDSAEVQEEAKGGGGVEGAEGGGVAGPESCPLIPSAASSTPSETGQEPSSLQDMDSTSSVSLEAEDEEEEDEVAGDADEDSDQCEPSPSALRPLTPVFRQRAGSSPMAVERVASLQRSQSLDEHGMKKEQEKLPKGKRKKFHIKLGHRRTSDSGDEKHLKERKGIRNSVSKVVRGFRSRRGQRNSSDLSPMKGLPRLDEEGEEVMPTGEPVGIEGLGITEDMSQLGYKVANSTPLEEPEDDLPPPQPHHHRRRKGSSPSTLLGSPLHFSHKARRSMTEHATSMPLMKPNPISKVRSRISLMGTHRRSSLPRLLMLPSRKIDKSEDKMSPLMTDLDDNIVIQRIWCFFNMLSMLERPEWLTKFAEHLEQGVRKHKLKSKDVAKFSKELDEMFAPIKELHQLNGWARLFYTRCSLRETLFGDRRRQYLEETLRLFLSIPPTTEGSQAAHQQLIANLYMFLKDHQVDVDGVLVGMTVHPHLEAQFERMSRISQEELSGAKLREKLLQWLEESDETVLSEVKSLATACKYGFASSLRLQKRGDLVVAHVPITTLTGVLESRSWFNTYQASRRSKHSLEDIDVTTGKDGEQAFRWMFVRFCRMEEGGAKVQVWPDNWEDQTVALDSGRCMVIPKEIRERFGSVSTMEGLVKGPSEYFDLQNKAQKDLLADVLPGIPGMPADLVPSLTAALMRDPIRLEHPELWGLDASSQPHSPPTSSRTSSVGMIPILPSQMPSPFPPWRLVQLPLLVQARRALVSFFGALPPEVVGESTSRAQRIADDSLADLDPECLFGPQRVKIFDRMQSCPDIAHEVFTRYGNQLHDLCHRAVSYFEPLMSSLLSGQFKQNLASWWTDFIRRRAKMLLNDAGYDHDAAPWDYINVAPASLEPIRANVEVLKKLMASLGTDQDPEDPLPKLIAELRKEIYPLVALLRKNLLMAVSSNLGHYDTMLDRETAQSLLGESPPSEVVNCLKDIEYLEEMERLEDAPEEHNPHVVPVSGLVVGRLLRYESEMRTILEVWGRNEKKKKQQPEDAVDNLPKEAGRSSSSPG